MEHKKDMDQLEGVKYTRARRTSSLMEIHQLVLTDHFVYNNHTINRDCVRVPVKEPDWKKGAVKKAIFIRTAVMYAINCDGEHHYPPKVSSKLLCCKTWSHGIFVALMKVPVGF